MGWPTKGIIIVTILVGTILTVSHKKMISYFRNTSFHLAVWALIFFLLTIFMFLLFGAFLDLNPVIDIIFLFLFITFLMMAGSIFKVALNEILYKSRSNKDEK